MEIGQRLASYEIRGRLGAGGMGEVYRAYDARLQRGVALKVLPGDGVEAPQARGRLLQEARAAAALNHPHIYVIYDVGESEGRAYIAMELVEGQPLDRALGRPLPTPLILDYGCQIADAVAHAHAHHVLHRDLKTSNIMLTPAGRVKVLDFGLAKRMAGPADATALPTAPVTEPGRISGTLAYMAPEQLRGEPATAASDVWALGVVLYEMTTGTRPFTGRTGFEIASAILNEPTPTLRNTVRPLAEIVARALAKEPSQRYQDAGELRAALEAARAVIADSPPDATPAAASRPGDLAGASSTPTRRPLFTAAAFVVLTALVAVFAISWPHGGRATPARSIAVLPIENLSGQPDEEHFVAGLQDGLIAELAQLRAWDRVIERGSTRRFRGTTQTVTEIAQALNVDMVLTGSVMRAGDRVQLAAQLIDADSQEHLWADRFERDARDVLAIQSDVAAGVAGAIGVAVPPQQRQRWSTPRPVDPQTYEAYLRGMHLVSRGASRDNRLRGLAILQEAIDRDPGNAHAYAGLALGYVTLGHGPGAEPDAWPKARAAALRALALDPELAEAHSSLAEVRAYYERDWAGAEQAFRRANELNPNLAFNHYHYAWFLALFSRWAEANAEHARAQELDPLTPVHTAHFGTLYLYQGRVDDAWAEARRAVEFAPNAPVSHLVLGRALLSKGLAAEAEVPLRRGASLDPALGEYELGMFLAETGRRDDARALLRKLEAQPPAPWQVWSLSQLNIALGDHDRAFYWLHRKPAHAFLPWIRVHPPYRRIHKDSRFVALMAELRLPMPE